MTHTKLNKYIIVCNSPLKYSADLGQPEYWVTKVQRLLIYSHLELAGGNDKSCQTGMKSV